MADRSVKTADKIVPGDKVLYVADRSQNKLLPTTVISVEKGGLQRMRQYTIRRQWSATLHFITCTRETMLWRKKSGWTPATKIRLWESVAVYEHGLSKFAWLIERSPTLVEGVARKIVTESGMFIGELVELGEY